MKRVMQCSVNCHNVWLGDGYCDDDGIYQMMKDENNTNIHNLPLYYSISSYFIPYIYSGQKDIGNC